MDQVVLAVERPRADRASQVPRADRAPPRRLAQQRAQEHPRAFSCLVKTIRRTDRRVTQQVVSAERLGVVLSALRALRESPDLLLDTIIRFMERSISFLAETQQQAHPGMQAVLAVGRVRLVLLAVRKLLAGFLLGSESQLLQLFPLTLMVRQAARLVV